MTFDEMVEAAARRVQDHLGTDQEYVWFDASDERRELYLKIARAALLAVLP